MSGHTPISFEQGWGAAPFKVQFPNLSEEAASQLDRVNHAITELYMCGVMTDSDVKKARHKKFPAMVGRALSEATGGDE